MWSAATVLVCALGILGRSAETLPPIAFIEVPPPAAYPGVEAFVLPGDDTIHLVTSSAVFRQAMAARVRCGQLQALRKIASVIVHEEWHVRNGPDEQGAYQAQLLALLMMGSGPGTPVFADVRRAMRAVTVAERAEGSATWRPVSTVARASAVR
jgi:hypothetical protein